MKTVDEKLTNFEAEYEQKSKELAMQMLLLTSSTTQNIASLPYEYRLYELFLLEFPKAHENYKAMLGKNLRLEGLYLSSN